MDLFASTGESHHLRPLAERLRPVELNDFVGQEKIAGETGSLVEILKQQNILPNLIFWGPPGSGKTSLALLLKNRVEAHFEQVSAIDTGAKKLRELGQAARDRKLQFGQSTIVFVDEIHRLNKSQQDVLLPFAERGDFSLIGATTENPSYELNKALLSRCRVVAFEPLNHDHLQQLLQKASEYIKVGVEEILQVEAQESLLAMANGDGRRLLNMFEQLVNAKESKRFSLPLTVVDLEKALEEPTLYYDKQGDEHYNCISAFIKSVRGSDPDAALYYLARMIKGGEDPVFIARRLVILASEDVGNADPRALTLAVSGLQAVELIGLPEAGINLAQVTTYLASAPKSNRSYAGYKQAVQVVEKTGLLPIPKALRSAQNSVAKQFGFGKDYKYSHEGPKGWLKQNFLPEELVDKKFYEPSERGFEKNIRQYLEWMKS